MDATELLTADELAGRLRVRAATIRLWGRQGRIPRIEISAKVIRYDPAAIIQFLHDRMTPNTDRIAAVERAQSGRRQQAL